MYHGLIAPSGVKELYTIQTRKLLQRNQIKQMFLGGEGVEDWWQLKTHRLFLECRVLGVLLRDNVLMGAFC